MQATQMKGRVLIVAGSDSGGGAGIQADIKAVTALGGYAATAITALTAQNTLGVFGVHEVPVEFIRQQIDLTVEDIGVDCVKTGMLHSVPVIEGIVESLDKIAGDVKLVIDPVMVAKGGHSLLEDSAVSAVRDLLLPRATLLTPNLPEAETLIGRKISSGDDMIRAGEELCKLGADAVLMKGGHAEGETVQDILVGPDGAKTFEGPRIDTPHTHGTGCTTASAIAAGLAQGLSIVDATARARAYVYEAIRTAPGFGGGHGPLNHAHTVRSDL